MSKEHVVRRVINGKNYLCKDVGCDDFDSAERNRGMVARKENISGYIQIEAIVKAWPSRKPLPYWIPQGDLPQVGKGENIHRYGMHEVND